MGDLGSKKIGSNYQKLLQISESGVVADGSGSYTTLILSGSKYYASGSIPSNYPLMALGITGSIVPEGSATWDLGSEDNPFREIFVSKGSIVFVDGTKDVDSDDRKIRLTKADVTDWLQGDFKKKVDSITKKRLSIPIATTIQTIITEPFEFNRFRNLYPVDLTASDTVQDTYWANDGDNLYLKPTRFGTIGMNTDDLEIV